MPVNKLKQLVKSYQVFLGLFLILLVLVWFGDACVQWLGYDREAIQSGEVWRLVTAHLVHMSLNHSLLNIATLLLVAYLIDPSEPKYRQLLHWLWLFLFTGVGLYLTAHNLLYYVGFSGVLHGALLVAIFSSPFYSKPIKWVVILILLSKVLWEQTPYFDDMANLDMIGGRTESRAHLMGFLAGWMWIFFIWVVNRYEQRRQPLEDSESHRGIR